MRVCLCFLACLQRQKQSNQTLLPLSLLLPPGHQPLAEHPSRGPSDALEPLSLPTSVAVLDSHILTSFPRALSSSLTFKKNYPFFLSLVYFISILIKTWMELDWVYLLGLPVGPGRIKGCCKAVLAVKQGRVSQRSRHDIVDNQQSPVAQVTWFWTVQFFKRSPSVMSTHWPPRSHFHIALLGGQAYLAGHLQDDKSRQFFAQCLKLKRV